ncbi:MAG: hypothetical protein QGE97_00490 [SAR324 cluster bacterium]|nr:hypothetical protein [SAR324 cluster bacterium]
MNQLKELFLTFSKCWDCFQVAAVFAEAGCDDHAKDLLDQSELG